MMIHGSMIWNFVNSMPQVYRGSPLVDDVSDETIQIFITVTNKEHAKQT